MAKFKEPYEAILKRAKKHFNFVDVWLKDSLKDNKLEVTYLYKGKIQTSSLPRRETYKGVYR